MLETSLKILLSRMLKSTFFFLCLCLFLFFYIVVVFVIHWHESAMDLHVFPIPIPPPTSLSTRSLWVFPVHQARALVPCIQPGLVICFTLDNIHVLMLFFSTCMLSSKDTALRKWHTRLILGTSFSLLYNKPSSRILQLSFPAFGWNANILRIKT